MEINELIEFINESPTIFQTVNNLANILSKSGYREIKENEKFQLKNKEKFFIRKSNNMLIAFDIEKDLLKDGMKIVGSHGDAPSFKIKPNPLWDKSGYMSINVESYGGSILSTWFDRALSVAGKVIVNNNGETDCRLVDVKKAVLTIPSLAIHLNRKVNDGYKFNKQDEMQPICGLLEGGKDFDDFLHFISKELNVNKGDILDFELYLYDKSIGEVIGINNDFLQSSRLDDLVMTYSSLVSFINCNGRSKALICADNEEVGSVSFGGATSSFIENTLERIFLSYGMNKEDFLIGISNSIVISADVAHGVHPNYGDKHDPTNRPMLGKGIVIKYSANQSYSTSSEFSSKLKLACKKRKVAYQDYVNHSNIIGGSTIGPRLSSKLGIPAIDLGIPLLGMHSIRELCAITDIDNAVEAFNAFYEVV
ncbi:MAG: M18 family aminopeptidase [Lachnospirales bacterium]